MRKRESEGEKERVAVVCKRACHESHFSMFFEEDVVDLSGDENEVSVCLHQFFL